MDKDLIEDKLYQVIDPFSGRKINHEIFILHYSAVYIHFMMKMEEFVRY